MKSAKKQLSWLVLPSTLIGFFVSSPLGLTQPITPANDGTNTLVSPKGNQFNINGGTRSSDGNNLFHSFERFGLQPGQVANFLSDPSIRNILGRVTGGEASIIQGLIQITGGNSNLFLMNPAGIIFGAGASLNVPADFTATTATGISFNNNWFNVNGNNNYNNLNGNPSGYAFAVAQPGVILNEGNLTLSPGHNLTLLGGTVINTGELSTPGGTINIVAVEGDSLVRISQEGQLLNLEVSPLNLPATESTITPLTLPQLLTGSKAYSATTVKVNEQGEVILTNSNRIIPEQSGVAIASGDMKGNVVLQADNDIIVNEHIETNESVELKAGRSININADINTTEENGDIIIQGNFDDGNAENRAEGAANINQQEGTRLDAGSGNIFIGLGKLGEVGDINLANINTKGEVIVNANGGNINRVSEDSLIIGGSALFQTLGKGGIGTETEPLRIQANNLEAVSGSGGIFVEALQGLTIGGVDDEIIGLSTQNGGDIVLNVEGNLTVNEDVSTQFTKNQDAGDITIITQGEFNSSKAPIISSPTFIDLEKGETWKNQENLGNAGNITIKADGNIIASDIYSSSNQGNGGDIILESQNGNIDTRSGDLNSFSGEGEGGNIDLTADGNITTSSISSSSNQGNGGDIILESQNGNIDTRSGDLNSFSGEGEGGNINLTADGNITTSSISSSSEYGNGGDITLESQNGNIDTRDTRLGFLISSSIEGEAGNINLTANGNITTSSISSSSNIGNGGDIILESQNGNIDTRSGNLNSFSYAGGNGGNINLNAKGIVIAGNIDAGGDAKGVEGGDITLTSHFNDVVTLGNLVRGSSKVSISAFGNIDLGTITGDTTNLTPNQNNLNPENGEVKLQAHNDITIREPLNLDQVSSLEIRAGRNINIKGDIDTSEGNGNIFLQANDPGADTTLRQEGTGSIIMAEGTTLNAGSGNITLQLGNFGDESNIGNIFISNIQTTGNVTVNALGGNILPRSPSTLIQAETAIFQTKDNGGIGQSENPLRLDVNYLEAVTGRGGAYFHSPQGNLTIGGASSFLNGITASEGGNIELSVAGNLKVQEPIFTGSGSSLKAGDISLNAEGTIDARGTVIQAYVGNQDAGNISISADGNIQSGSILGNNINIESTTGSIDTTQGFISSFSYEFKPNNIILSARGNIQTGFMSGSTINIESTTGSINTTQGSISSFYHDGKITLSARGDIQTGSILGSNINIESTTGSINTTQGSISSFYHDGKITLSAEGDIQTGFISLVTNGTGNTGNIEIKTSAGSINTTQGEILSSSEDGNSGNITLSAQNNIITGNIYSSVQEDIYNNVKAQGNAGNIILESRNGSIDTTSGYIFSSSVNGNSGSISFSALGDIRTSSVDVASAFEVTFESDPNTGFSRPVINFDNPIERTNGLAGDITITSTNGSINTIGGTINSQSPDGSGNIILQANGDITTGLMTAAALNSSKATTGGDVSITSNSGNINITQNLETFSEKGTAGNVTLNTSKGNITTQAILSNGYEQGGHITIGGSDTNAINLQGSLTTLSENGMAGDVNLTANEGITVNGIHSEGLQQGGNIEIFAENGSINATQDNIETFSEQGIAGNVRLNAMGSINTNNITSYGNTQSGSVSLNSFSNSILTQNITTQANNGPSGNILLNSYGIEGNIEAANLYSIGNTQSGDITIIAEDGSIQTQNILTSSETGDSGDVNINAKNGSVTTEDIESISDSENSGDININASEDANLGNVRTIAGENSGDININATNVNARNIESIAGNTSGNIDISAQNLIDVGKITTSGGVNSGTVNLNSETGQIYHQGIKIGDDLKVEIPNNVSSNLNTTPSSVSIPTITWELNLSPQIPPVFIPNLHINHNLSSLSPVHQSSKIPVVINNNLTISPTPNHTNYSSDNSLDSSNLALDLQLNSYSPSTLAADVAFQEIEQTRTQEFKTYLEEGLAHLLVTKDTVRNVLKNIQQQTGNLSAVVYVSLKSQQLELIVFDASGQPYLQTIPVSKDEFLKVKQEFIATITSPRLRNSNDYLVPAQKLYQWLIRPIETHLKSAKIDTLIFSMDSGLRSLPIAALHDGQQFLVEKYSLSLIPSISLMDTQYRALGDAPVLGMGASEFKDFSALPAVPVELEIITEQLRQGQAFINEKFTQSNLIKQRQNYPYRIVHLATHTEFLPGSLDHSFIQLWKDERLYFHQFRQLKLNNPPVDLLVLSSCRTAIGNEEAELGFAGVAVQMGVKSVLASLWYVDDKGTLGLMSEFYSHLNQSPIKAEALRQAQIAMINRQVGAQLGALQGSVVTADQKASLQLISNINQDFSHPYYWSGFTMVGSPW